MSADMPDCNINSDISNQVDDVAQTWFVNPGKQAGNKEAVYLEGALADVTKIQEQSRHEPVVPVKVRQHMQRMELRLPRFAHAVAKERAKSLDMSLARWAEALILSHLVKIPVMTDEELKVLRYLTTELSNIRRVFSQAFRFHSVELTQALRLLQESPAAVQIPELAEIEEMVELLKVSLALILEAQEAVHTLIRVSNARWEHL